MDDLIAALGDSIVTLKSKFDAASEESGEQLRNTQQVLQLLLDCGRTPTQKVVTWLRGHQQQAVDFYRFLQLYADSMAVDERAEEGQQQQPQQHRRRRGEGAALAPGAHLALPGGQKTIDATAESDVGSDDESVMRGSTGAAPGGNSFQGGHGTLRHGRVTETKSVEGGDAELAGRRRQRRIRSREQSRGSRNSTEEPTTSRGSLRSHSRDRRGRHRRGRSRNTAREDQPRSSRASQRRHSRLRDGEGK